MPGRRFRQFFRMKRGIVSSLTALSLLLGAAACVLWARSRVRADMVGWMTFEGGHYDGHFCERRAEERRGCCGACGYDLRGTPGRCPECGHKRDTGVRASPSATSRSPLS